MCLEERKQAEGEGHTPPQPCFQPKILNSDCDTDSFQNVAVAGCVTLGLRSFLCECFFHLEQNFPLTFPKETNNFLRVLFAVKNNSNISHLQFSCTIVNEAQNLKVPMIVQQRCFALCKDILTFSVQLAPGGALGEVHGSAIHSLAMVWLNRFPAAHNVQ